MLIPANPSGLTSRRYSVIFLQTPHAFISLQDTCLIFPLTCISGRDCDWGKFSNLFCSDDWKIHLQLKKKKKTRFYSCPQASFWKTEMGWGGNWDFKIYATHTYIYIYIYIYTHTHTYTYTYTYTYIYLYICISTNVWCVCVSVCVYVYVQCVCGYTCVSSFSEMEYGLWVQYRRVA